MNRDDNVIRMWPEGHRTLPAITEVERLLSVEERVVDGRAALSFSLKGLWTCGAYRNVFDKWAPKALQKARIEEGFDLVAVRSEGVVDDWHVSVVHGRALAVSSVPTGRMARRLLAQVYNDLVVNSATTVGTADAGIVATVGAAARLIAEDVDPVVVVRSSDGTERSLPTPQQAPSLLDVGERRIGGRRRLTVSILGLWYFSKSTLSVAQWFEGFVRKGGWAEGVQYALRDDLGRPWIDAVYASILLAGRDAASVRARDLIAEAVAVWPPSRSVGASKAPQEGGSMLEDDRTVVHEGNGPTCPEEPIAMDGAPSTHAKPWDEAFDFGRLVPVEEREIGGVMVQTVSARAVHAFLGARDRFPTWFEDQVARCSLKLGFDHAGIFREKPFNSGRGRPPQEYALVLSAAKKVAMRAAGLRGNAVREYFIECERRLEAGESPIRPAVDLRLAVSDPMPRSPSAEGDWTQVFLDRLDRSGAAIVPLAVPLSLGEFLYLRGLDRKRAALIERSCSDPLVLVLQEAGSGDRVVRHPVSRRVCFEGSVLEAWWETLARVALAATS